MTEQVLIATLGTEPQVVTQALDILRAKGYEVAKAIVVHTLGAAIQIGLQCLSEAFAQADLSDCAYVAEAVEDDGRLVDDIATETDVAALLRTLYRVVLAEKRAGRLIHLSIAGGRKPMAVYGTVVAQLLFDEDDRVWHLLTPGWRPGGDRVMRWHPGDDAQLVPVPVLRWASVSPVLTELALAEDPWQAIQAQRRMRQSEEMRRRREFLERWLTPAESDVVRLVVQGLDNASIARRLQKSESTVTNQLTSVYGKLHEWRGYRTDVPVSRSVLVAEFAMYFAVEGR